MGVVKFGGQISLGGANKYIQDLKKIQKELQNLTGQFESSKKATEELEKKQAGLQKEYNNTTKKISEIEEKIAKYNAEIKKGSAGTENWKKALADAEAILKIYQESLKNTQAEIEKYNQALIKNGAELKDLGSKYTDLGEKFATISKLSTAGLSSMSALVMKTASNADDINTLSKTTGIATDELQKFAYASNLIDVSQETITGSLRKLTQSMDNARDGATEQVEAFKQLGVAYTNTDGSLRDRSTVFYEIIDALSEMTNKTERTSIAQTLLGRGADELNPLIEAGSQALKDYGAEAENLGIILSQDTLNDLNLFNDEMDKFKAQFSGDLAVAGANILTGLQPVIENIMNVVIRLTDAYAQLSPQQQAFVGEMLIMGAALAPILKGFGSIITTLGSYTQILGSGVSVTAGLTGALSSLGPALIAVTAAIAGLTAYYELAKGKEAEVSDGLRTLTNSLDDSKRGFSELSQQTNETIAKYDELTQSAFDNATATETNADRAKELVNRLDELQNSTNLTASEQEEQRSIVEQLNALFPNLGIAIDDTTGKLNMNTKAIWDNIEAMKGYAKVDALKTAYGNAVLAENTAKESTLQQRADLQNKYKLTDEQIDLIANRGLAFKPEYADFTALIEKQNKTAEDEAFVSFIYSLINNGSITNPMDAYTFNKEKGKQRDKEVSQFISAMTDYMGTRNTYISQSDKVSDYERQLNEATTQLNQSLNAGNNIATAMDSAINKLNGASSATIQAFINANASNLNATQREKLNSLLLQAKNREASVNTATNTARNTTSNTARNTATNTASTQTKTASDYYKEDLQILNAQHTNEVISEEEYLQRMLQLRQQYYEDIDYLDRISLDHQITQLQEKNKKALEEQQKADYEAQNKSSYAWINQQLNNGADFDVLGAYGRIGARITNAWNRGIISDDTYLSDKEALRQQQVNYYNALKQNSQQYISDRNTYNDWGSDSEKQAYERMLQRAKEYYDKGILNYKEYLAEVRGLNQSIYSAQIKEQETLYANAEQQIKNRFSARKNEINAQIQDLNNQVSSLQSKYQQQNTAKNIAKLKEEANLYSHSATFEGQEHYQELLDQIEQAEQQEAIRKLQEKNNEIIAKLQEEYTSLQEQENQALESIKNNTDPSIIQGYIDSIGGAVTSSVSNAINNQTNTTNNNNQTINQAVTISGGVGELAKKLLNLKMGWKS